MAKKKNDIKPRYDFMFDAYVNTAKIAYDEYKKAVQQFYKYSWIGDDGSLFILNQESIFAKIDTKRKEYEDAMQKMNAFKTLYGDEIERLRYESQQNPNN